MASVEADLLALLQRLSGAGEDADAEGLDDADAGMAGGAVGALTPDDLAVVRAAVPHFEAHCEDVPAFWRGVVQSGVSFVALTKGLGAMLRDADSCGAWLACAFYATLLRLHGCPVSPGPCVHELPAPGRPSAPRTPTRRARAPARPQVSSLFDPYTFSRFLQALKRAAASAPTGAPAKAAKGASQASQGARKAGRGKKGGKKGGRGGGDSADEAAASDSEEDEGGARAGGEEGAHADGVALGMEALASLRVFVGAFGLRGYAEMLGLLIETCVDVTRACAPSTRAAAARGAGQAAAPGARARCTGLARLRGYRGQSPAGAC